MPRRKREHSEQYVAESGRREVTTEYVSSRRISYGQPLAARQPRDEPRQQVEQRVAVLAARHRHHDAIAGREQLVALAGLPHLAVQAVLDRRTGPRRHPGLLADLCERVIGKRAATTRRSSGPT